VSYLFTVGRMEDLREGNVMEGSPGDLAADETNSKRQAKICSKLT
jgi:hypothetical protein